ncbi:MAG: Uma2 family endonuclease [Gemmatimonadales bacterium]
MSESARSWTRADVLALPDDGNRYELVDGELLVTPIPRPAHQEAVLALVERLRPYVRAHALGHCLVAPADLDLQAGQLLQPDVFVLPNRAEGLIQQWSEAGIPILAAEVLSPATARFDRGVKRQRYQRSGVATYWIVDSDARLMEVWVPGARSPRIVEEVLAWRPSNAVPPLEIDLARMFAEVCGGR